MKEGVSMGVIVLLLCMIENLIIKELFKRKRRGTAEVSGDSSFWSTFCPPAKNGKGFMGEDGKAGEEGGTGEKTVRLPFASPTPYSPAGATTSCPGSLCGGTDQEPSFGAPSLPSSESRWGLCPLPRAYQVPWVWAWGRALPAQPGPPLCLLRPFLHLWPRVELHPQPPTPTHT